MWLIAANRWYSFFCLSKQIPLQSSCSPLFCFPYTEFPFNCSGWSTYLKHVESRHTSSTCYSPCQYTAFFLLYKPHCVLVCMVWFICFSCSVLAVHDRIQSVCGILCFCFRCYPLFSFYNLVSFVNTFFPRIFSLRFPLHII